MTSILIIQFKNSKMKEDIESLSTSKDSKGAFHKLLRGDQEKLISMTNKMSLSGVQMTILVWDKINKLSRQCKKLSSNQGQDPVVQEILEELLTIM